METLLESVSGSEVNESNGSIIWFIPDMENLTPQNILTNYRNLTRFDFADSPRQRCFAAARIAPNDNEAHFVTIHYSSALRSLGH